jgi:hypothetical protein
MNEILYFKIGVWAGYLFTIACIILYAMVMITLENRRKEKYLVEIKGLHAYEEWKRKNTVKIGFIKNK